jgi:hypothetical protein
MTEIIGLRNHELTEDGSLLSLTFEGRLGEMVTVSMSTCYLDALLVSLGRVQQETTVPQGLTKVALSFRGLQSWSVSSVPGQEYVFVVLDGSTALEAPYALRPEVAEELGSAMLNSARATREQRRDH